MGKLEIIPELEEPKSKRSSVRPRLDEGGCAGIVGGAMSSAAEEALLSASSGAGVPAAEGKALSSPTA